MNDKEKKILGALKGLNLTMETWCEDCRRGAVAEGIINADDECPWECTECLGWVKDAIERTSDQVKAIIAGEKYEPDLEA